MQASVLGDDSQLLVIATASHPTVIETTVHNVSAEIAIRAFILALVAQFLVIAAASHPGVMETAVHDVVVEAAVQAFVLVRRCSCLAPFWPENACDIYVVRPSVLCRSCLVSYVLKH